MATIITDRFGKKTTIGSSTAFSDSDKIDGNTVIWDSEYQRWTYGEGGGKGGLSIHDSEVLYKKDDVVVRNNSIYKANTDFRQGDSDFTIGVDSEQWTPLTGVFLSGENGRSFGSGLTSTSNLELNVSAIGQWDPIEPGYLEFTAQSAGKFDVSFQGEVFGVSSDTYNLLGFSINGEEPTINNYKQLETYSGGGVDAGIYFQSILDLNEGDVVTAVYRQNSGSVGAFEIRNGPHVTYGTAPRNVPSISWNKVGDFIPAIGLKAAHAHIKLSADILQPDYLDTLEFDSICAPVGITLSGTDGIVVGNTGTYRLTCQFQLDATNGTSIGNFQVEKNGVLIGQAQNILSSQRDIANESPYLTDNLQVLVDCQSGDVLKIKESSSTSGMNVEASGTNIIVEQIASQAPLYKDYEASYLLAGTNGSSDPIVINSPITCWQTNQSKGITYNGTSFGPLRAGVTYELEADVGISSAIEGSSESLINWAWGVAGQTGTITILGVQGMRVSGASDYVTNGADKAVAIFTPSVDTYVQVYGLSNSGSADVAPDTSKAIIKAISNHLPITNADKLVGLNDVNTSAYSTIPAGASLKCFDGVNFEPDTKEFQLTATNVTVDTGYGFGVEYGNLSGQQDFYIQNLSGSTKTYYKMSNYITTVSSASSVSRETVANNLYTEFWQDSTLSVTTEGEMSIVKFKVADDLAAFHSGNWEEYEVTGIVGSPLSASKFIVKRIR